jgi:hypothetical protein
MNLFLHNIGDLDGTVPITRNDALLSAPKEHFDYVLTNPERDKTSLDIFWLKDKSLVDLDNLPSPDVLAGDIMENLQAALESFKTLAENLKA